MANNKTSDGLEIIKHRFGIDPTTDPRVQAFSDDCRIAQMVYDARQSAGMSQAQLAAAIGTAEGVIADLENADYDGDAFSMLRRIADALHLKIHVELVPAEG